MTQTSPKPKDSPNVKRLNNIDKMLRELNRETDKVLSEGEELEADRNAWRARAQDFERERDQWKEQACKIGSRLLAVVDELDIAPKATMSAYPVAAPAEPKDQPFAPAFGADFLADEEREQRHHLLRHLNYAAPEPIDLNGAISDAWGIGGLVMMSEERANLILDRLFAQYPNAISDNDTLACHIADFIPPDGFDWDAAIERADATLAGGEPMPTFKGWPEDEAKPEPAPAGNLADMAAAIERVTGQKASFTKAPADQPKAVKVEAPASRYAGPFPELGIPSMLDENDNALFRALVRASKEHPGEFMKVAPLYALAKLEGYTNGEPALRFRMHLSANPLAKSHARLIETQAKPLGWKLRTPSPDGGDKVKADDGATVTTEPSPEHSDEVANVRFNKGKPDEYALKLDYFPFFGEYKLRKMRPPVGDAHYWECEDEWSGSLGDVFSSVSAKNVRKLSAAMKTECEAAKAPAEPAPSNVVTIDFGKAKTAHKAMVKPKAIKRTYFENVKVDSPVLPAGYPDKGYTQTERGIARMAWVDANVAITKDAGGAQCQCCYRELQANNGIVRDHSHKRRDGWHEGACSGSNKMPLNLDFTELKAQIESAIPAHIRHVQLLIEHIEDNDKVLQWCDETQSNVTQTAETYAAMLRDKAFNGHYGFVHTVLTLDQLDARIMAEDSWEEYKAKHLARHNTQIKNLMKELRERKAKLAAWKPTAFFHNGRTLYALPKASK